MKLLSACLTMLIASFTFSQGRLTGYKADGTIESKIDQSDYFTQKLKENDTTYVIRYYQTKGPMIRWETYKDDNFSIKHGMYGWYNRDGFLDSSGRYYEGSKDSYWNYGRRDNVQAQIQEKYERGILIDHINFITRTIKHANGVEESLDKPKPPLPTDTSKIFTIIQHAAEFPGGIAGWNQYISSNVKTPDRFLKLANGPRKAPVVFSFIIEPKNGRTADIFIIRSQEFSVDMEAIRVVKNSPPWTPANQNGREVIYRHMQTLTFQVNN